MRLTVYNNEIYIGHYFVSNYTLKAILEEIELFLEKHPKEFVFIFMKDDWMVHKWSQKECRQIWTHFKDKYKLPQGVNVLNSTIGGMRGRIIPVINSDYVKYKPPKIGYLHMNSLDIIQCWNCKTVEKAKENIENNITKIKFNKYRGIGLTVVYKIGNIPIPPWFVHNYLNEWMHEKIQTDWKDCKLGFIGFDYVKPDFVKSLYSMNF